MNEWIQTRLDQGAKALRFTKELVFPTFLPPDPEAVAADARAATVWHEVFAPLNVMIEDADVLELACHDGRLVASLLDGGEQRARSGVGVDANGVWVKPDGEIVWPEHHPTHRLELHTDMSYLQAFDLSSFDLILTRDLEKVFSLTELNDGLRRIYDLLRPGGEALLHVRCAPVGAGEGGYGFLTPTSWISAFMRIGFEVGAVRRVWRPAEEAAQAAAVLPHASDDERMTAEMTVRLVRPWESWELAGVWTIKVE